MTAARRARAFVGLGAALGIVLSGCAVPPATQPPTGLALHDLGGAPHRPLLAAPGEVQVLVFTSQECPIANGYAPTLRELAGRWASEPRVHLFLVHVDPDLTAAAAQAHAADYALPGTILLDPQQRLARALGATITPEAAVWTSAGLLYRGRIDDQWRALGSRAPAASVHDLADAVDRALAGDVVVRPWPPATGCRLPEPAAASRGS